MDFVSVSALFMKSRSSPERYDTRSPSRAFRYPSLNSALPRSFSLTGIRVFSASEKRLLNRFSKNEMISSLVFLDDMSPRCLDILVSLHASLGYPYRRLPLW
ncbi:hypothetical protein ES707_05894 [subsurface metagenome]